MGLRSRAVPAGAAVLSRHEIGEISLLPPQQQAVRLLERATDNYAGAAELIEQRVGKWFGSLTFNREIGTALQTAFDSKDLRVRAAAVEISLAAHHLSKDANTVENVAALAKFDEGNRGFHLWTLGLLGNRGAGVARARQCLLKYLRDPNEDIREWAVNGLALLGTDDVVPALLEVLRTDASLAVRERAACNIADAGMLTRAQRRRAVPELLRLADDAAMPSEVRKWVFGALHDITGQRLGNDAAAWREWYAQQK